jgi:hypothetical protein
LARNSNLLLRFGGSLSRYLAVELKIRNSTVGRIACFSGIPPAFEAYFLLCRPVFSPSAENICCSRGFLRFFEMQLQYFYMYDTMKLPI